MRFRKFIYQKDDIGNSDIHPPMSRPLPDRPLRLRNADEITRRLRADSAAETTAGSGAEEEAVFFVPRLLSSNWK